MKVTTKKIPSFAPVELTFTLETEGELADFLVMLDTEARVRAPNNRHSHTFATLAQQIRSALI